MIKYLLFINHSTFKIQKKISSSFNGPNGFVYFQHATASGQVKQEDEKEKNTTGEIEGQTAPPVTAALKTRSV